MKNNPPILIISMAVYYGGGESYLLNLEKLLSKKYEITIITSSKILQNKSISKTIFVRKIRLLYFIAIFSNILKFIVTKKPKFVILNGPLESSFSKFFKIVGVETIAVKHTDFYEDNLYQNQFPQQAVSLRNSLRVTKNILY